MKTGFELSRIPRSAKIISLCFSNVSHDQGWVSDRHSNSYSWGECSIIDKTSNGGVELSVRLCLWRNRVGKKDWNRYDIVFFTPHQFIQSCEEHYQNGIISIWLRSMFPGWECHYNGGYIGVIYLENR